MRQRTSAVMRTAGCVLAAVLLTACDRPPPAPTEAEHRAAVEAWQAGRMERLRSGTGWLSLVGLEWLEPGSQSFGSGPEADLRVDDPNLPPVVGRFILEGDTVTFTALPDVTVTHHGQAVQRVTAWAPDLDEVPVFERDTVDFYVIERSGEFGVRVKDSASPVLTGFEGIETFPISADWRFWARFEPYADKTQKILNVSGQVEDMQIAGALVFEKDGRSYRLDAMVEEGNDEEYFVMFADATSGDTTYGAGRYIYVDRPEADSHWVELDFNRAYNPPCVFTDYATCPLPPKQNRLDLAVTAGEKDYGEH